MALLPSVEEIAEDMYRADPLVPASEILKIIKRSKQWIYPWGCILADAQEMHIHVMSGCRKRVYLKKPLKEVADIMFKRYHILVTRILKKPEVLEFDLRMGWKLVDESDLFYHLEMTKKDFRYE